MKKISVAIATYNGENFLKKQIDSILEQTIVPDEIIVVDDQSTDKTIKILNEYAQRFNFIKIYENETRLGPIKNFNKSLNKTTGDIIFFSDQDDIWDKNKIEKMVSCGIKSDLLYSDAKIIDENNKIMYESEIVNFRSDKPITGNNYLYFMEANCISGHNMMISRRLADSIIKFPVTTMYDQFLSFACAIQYRIDYIDEKLCFHRIHKNNFINNSSLYGKNELKINKKIYLNRKLKFEEKKEKYRELFENIKFNNEERSLLLVTHLENYKKIFFDYRLFKMLLSKKSEMYPKFSTFKQLIKIFRFCRGLKGYWLPS